MTKNDPVEAFVETVRFSVNPQERQKALEALDKLGLVEGLDHDRRTITPSPSRPIPHSPPKHIAPKPVLSRYIDKKPAPAKKGSAIWWILGAVILSVFIMGNIISTINEAREAKIRQTKLAETKTAIVQARNVAETATAQVQKIEGDFRI